MTLVNATLPSSQPVSSDEPASGQGTLACEDFAVSQPASGQGTLAFEHVPSSQPASSNEPASGKVLLLTEMFLQVSLLL